MECHRTYTVAPPPTPLPDGNESSYHAASTSQAELFVNTVDNVRLDDNKFIVFARVVSGMDAFVSAYSYGRMEDECDPPNPQECPGPLEERVYSEGNAYLESDFPLMDYIIEASVKAQPPGDNLETFEVVAICVGSLGVVSMGWAFAVFYRRRKAASYTNKESSEGASLIDSDDADIGGAAAAGR